MQTRKQFTNWKTEKAYGNVYRLSFPTADGCKTLSGTAEDIILNIAVPHRVIRVEVRCMTSAHVNSGSAHLLRIWRDAGQVSELPYHSSYLFDNNYMLEAIYTKEFGERKEYEPTAWKVRIDGTATDIISVVMYVQAEV